MSKRKGQILITALTALSLLILITAVTVVQSGAYIFAGVLFLIDLALFALALRVAHKCECEINKDIG